MTEIMALVFNISFLLLLELWHYIISKAFDRVWHADVLHRLQSSGNSFQAFRLIPSFLSIIELGVIDRAWRDFGWSWL